MREYTVTIERVETHTIKVQAETRDDAEAQGVGSV